MRIAVIGTGYVGLVAGACLAETGIEVFCVDIDQRKVARLQRGEIPIYEPGLEPLLKRNVEDRRLTFTTDIVTAIRESEVIFIAVGTPPDEDGSADLKHVLDVAAKIGEHMNGEKVVITKSTVPVGTAARVRAEIEKRTQHPVHVCSNPEFLKEGAAVDDFMKPDRVVIGVDSEHAKYVLTEVYAPFVRTGNPIIFMDVASAEITKYAANAMLATRISFMNMIASLCEKVGANVDLVRKGIGTDSRIGNAFLFAGCGYGGSCFPKDVNALMQTLSQQGVNAGILKAVEQVNEAQKHYLLERVIGIYGADLSAKTFAVWGLSFKPETDDMREAPSLVVVRGLLERGATVRVNDPEAMGVARDHFGNNVEYCEDNYETLRAADALLILTEWRPYRRPNFDKMRQLMRRPLILDGRNLFEPEQVLAQGFEYISIGRPAMQKLD
ncbi:MAG: UDP-glucose dehydrogenase family protein [Gemmatimonadota bacterium]